jgi:hypothetical protein
MLQKSIDAARSITFGDQQVIKQVDIMVWEDENNFPGQVDCGQLAPALRTHFSDQKHIRVRSVTHGDIFCCVLNRAVAIQAQSGCRYSIIASPEANSYWNKHIVGNMVQAAKDGALAIGVAINELQESILQGRIANTFAMWHNLSLLTVGGFDLRAAKPPNVQEAHFMQGWHKDDGTVYYHLAGVEEMIPLARLVRYHGACTASIMPTDSNGEPQWYELPQDTELLRRHHQKMGTKFERQCAFLATENVDPSFLMGGVMPQYRK